MGKPKDFVKWLDTLENMSVGENLRWSDYQQEVALRRPRTSEEMVRQKFLGQTTKILNENEKRYLDFGGWGEALALAGLEPSISFCYGLNFSSASPLKLSRLSFKSLVAHGPSVELTDIWADTLDLRYCADVTLRNCFIGTLSLQEIAASTFEMRGGAVLDIACSSPSGDIPFTGSVYFDKRVYFPRAPGHRLKGPQPYRNMRAHMLKLENTPMVSRFHTLEQATERKMEGLGFHRGISALYECLSDYGSSALRPFLLFIALFVITLLVALLTDGAAHADIKELSGWQTALEGDDWCARAIRAVVLAGQATLNPLGIFGTKGLLVAKTGALALWLSVHGLLSTIFIALFIFAIRRRFKMS